LDTWLAIMMSSLAIIDTLIFGLSGASADLSSSSLRSSEKIQNKKV